MCIYIYIYIYIFRCLQSLVPHPSWLRHCSSFCCGSGLRIPIRLLSRKLQYLGPDPHRRDPLHDHEILPTRYRCALAGPLRLCNIVMGAKVWYSHPRLPWDEVRIALAIQRRIPVLLNRVRFKHVCTYRNVRSPWYIEGNIQQVHVHMC